MKKSKKKLESKVTLSDSEIRNKVTQIRELFKQGNVNDLEACVLLSELIIESKLSKHGRLLGLYNELGFSASEAQKRAKIGKRFKARAKSGQMAAYSISHLKQMMEIEDSIVDVIVAEETRVTFEQLKVIRQFQDDFTKCESGEEIGKLLGKLEKFDEIKSRPRPKDEDTHIDVPDEVRNSEDFDTEEGDDSLIKLPTSHSLNKEKVAKISISEELKKVRDEIISIKNRIDSTTIRKERVEKIQRIIDEIKEIVEDIELSK